MNKKTLIHDTATHNQYDKATSRLAVFVLADKEKEIIGNILASYPKDGAGNLTVFIRILGLPLVRGKAGGYGYDKLGAAMYEAGLALNNRITAMEKENLRGPELLSLGRRIAESLAQDQTNWKGNLGKAGIFLAQII